MKTPVLLIHGYSDDAPSFLRWKQILMDNGYADDDVHLLCYKSLTNEITIKDIAEGFERAIRLQTGLEQDQAFDAIVHSTGMLVIRAWLTNYSKRAKRLKHLIGLAPATFGSPLAHKGRSTLGAIFKGNRELGPDFGEAGDLVLDALELGSRFTWDLALDDMLGEETFYGPDRKTPYAFVLCGTKGYGGIRKLMHPDGSDGTVRWAGTPLNTRKIDMDLTVKPGEKEPRFHFPDFTNVDIPMIPLEGLNHGTILSNPTDLAIELVTGALAVSDRATYEAWFADAAAKTRRVLESVPKYQQFVVRAIDERGDPIHDYNIRLYRRKEGAKKVEYLDHFDMQVHTYEADPSFRCFHVNLDKLSPSKLGNLWFEFTASSGSYLVGYLGFSTPDRVTPGVEVESTAATQTIRVDISKMLNTPDFKFFYPFTTTLIQLMVNREPLPPDAFSEVCKFWKPGG